MHQGGTVQNLGYAVLWPVFGAAFVYMWFRFLQLEKLKDAEDDAELTALAAGARGRAGNDEPAITSGAGSSTPDPREGSAPVPTGEGGEASAPVFRTDGQAPTQARIAPGDVHSEVAVSGNRDGGSADSAEPGDHPRPEQPRTSPRVSRNSPSTGVTVAVAMVGNEADDEDPELAAYNRALAALAEKDHRRAH